MNSERFASSLTLYAELSVRSRSRRQNIATQFQSRTVEQPCQRLYSRRWPTTDKELPPVSFHLHKLERDAPYIIEELSYSSLRKIQTVTDNDSL